MVKMVPRGYTASADAYLTPHILRYLATFMAGFDDGLPAVQLAFMQSDGGLSPVESFSGHKAILSGPAGGVVGYALTTQWEGMDRSSLQVTTPSCQNSSSRTYPPSCSTCSLAPSLPLHPLLSLLLVLPAILLHLSLSSSSSRATRPRHPQCQIVLGLLARRPGRHRCTSNCSLSQQGIGQYHNGWMPTELRMSRHAEPPEGTHAWSHRRPAHPCACVCVWPRRAR